MSDLSWQAEGIAQARAAGGVDLEVYRRPGFTGGLSVRRLVDPAGGVGFEVDSESDDDQ